MASCAAFTSTRTTAECSPRPPGTVGEPRAGRRDRPPRPSSTSRRPVGRYPGAGSARRREKASPSAPAQGPRSGRPPRQPQSAKLGDPGALTLGGVLSDRRCPCRFREGENHLASVLVDPHAGREGALHLDNGSKELVGAPGRVGAHEDRSLLVLAHLLGELIERIDEHADVIGGGVGAGVAGPKGARKGLTAQVAEHRVEAEAALVGGGGALLVGVGGEQGGVDVEDDLGRASPRSPGARPVSYTHLRAHETDSYL